LIKPNKLNTKEQFLLFLAEYLGPLLIRTLCFLCRYKVEGREHLEAALGSGKGIIVALWHGRMLLPIYHHRNEGFVSLVSLSKDGEFITRIVQRLGYTIRRGSPRKGGREGFMAMLRDLKAGRNLAIFPDGPTGPRHSIHDGVIHLARLTGSPIVPMIYSAYPSWQARSWDRFMIMKPFSRGIVKYGEPIYLPRRIKKEDELEYHRDKIRTVLIDMEQGLDRRMDVSR